MRTCVILNPAARGDKARHFREQLARFTAHVAFKTTAAPQDARRLAAEAVAEGLEVVVAAGGDGTVNEVLNGMGDADGFERVRLGVLPLGTVNVFAREMNLPLNVNAAWEVIRRARETRIDLPYAEFSNGNEKTSPSPRRNPESFRGKAERAGPSPRRSGFGHAGGVRGIEFEQNDLLSPARSSLGGGAGEPSAPLQRRYFAQMAGAGLDARAIELLDWQHKKAVGPLAYVVAGFRAVREPQPKITVTAGGQNVTGELVLVGNGKFYGGRFEVFPGADLRDGLLEVCVVPRVTWMTLVRNGLVLLLSGRLPSGVQRIQTPSFTLTAESCAAFELDGEWVGRLPVTFGVGCERLRVIVP
jgi:diacylglycerol kinase family enzyme